MSNGPLKFLRAAFENSPDAFCEYCGRQVYLTVFPTAANRATVDHRIPRSRGGGSMGRANLAVACCSCNHRKGPLTEAEFRAVMHDEKAIKLMVERVTRQFFPDQAPLTKAERVAKNVERDIARAEKLTGRLTDPKPDCPKCKGRGEWTRRGRRHPCVCRLLPITDAEWEQERLLVWELP